MLKSNKKRGFTLIESLCAICVLSILFVAVVSMQLNNMKLKRYNKEVSQYLYILEAVQKQIVYNCSYEDIKNTYSANKKYITKNKLSMDYIKQCQGEDLFEAANVSNETYIVMNVAQGEVLKIELELHIKIKQREEIVKSEFYKGNYS